MNNELLKWDENVYGVAEITGNVMRCLLGIDFQWNNLDLSILSNSNKNF